MIDPSQWLYLTFPLSNNHPLSGTDEEALNTLPHKSLISQNF
jgi:hypothetical protein